MKHTFTRAGFFQLRGVFFFCQSDAAFPSQTSFLTWVFCSSTWFFNSIPEQRTLRKCCLFSNFMFCLCFVLCFAVLLLCSVLYFGALQCCALCFVFFGVLLWCFALMCSVLALCFPLWSKKKRPLVGCSLGGTKEVI